MKLFLQKKDKGTSKTVPKPAQTSSKVPAAVPSVQSWLPIGDVYNGTVYRKDGYIVKAVRIQPINIHLLSEKEQHKKIKALMEVMNGMDFYFHTISIGRPVDLDSYILGLEKMKNEETNFVKRKILEGSIRDAAALATGGEALDRQFYILLPEPPSGKPKHDEDNLYRKATEVATNLSSADLLSYICDDQELRELQFIFLNPTQAAYERAPYTSGPYVPTSYVTYVKEG